MQGNIIEFNQNKLKNYLCFFFKVDNYYNNCF